MSFKKVLIANRGEIAIRILRTCQEIGLPTVAIHSEADENSLHVKLADESVCIGPAKSQGSYLNIPSILSAAEITGADAIHPGFGFLSENKDFCEMCDKWGVTFIGPSAKIIEEMGDKIRSKIIAKKAGVPVLEPINVQEVSADSLKDRVLEMKLPVLIKASAGGGGRGMQRIDNLDDLEGAIQKLRQEAEAAFGDGTLFIEKYITNPRHIEVQILGDQHGKIVHIGERDCTIQRRFQKIIEESPSPVLNEQQRDEICQSAVNLAHYVNYDSVGTVEFLYDQDEKKYYFMEMNTRIQVEHPVSEMRTGIDLIAQQIKSAQGDNLEFEQKDIHFIGHTIECRINAEDPETNLPSPGLVTHYHRPGGMGVRVDDFIYSGYMVPPFYDSMMSKVICLAQNREKCINRMKRALDEMVIQGIKTNIQLHQKIMNNPVFISSNFSTSFLEKNL